MAARKTCDSGCVASTLCYCMTVTGMVVLVAGTLCFAWWSEEDAEEEPASRLCPQDALSLRPPVPCSGRTPEVVAIPTYEEVVHCRLAEGPLTPPAYPVEEDPERSASGDALLGAQPPLPPPSYESLILADGGFSGETTPGAACSCPGPVQIAGEEVKGF
ncbi:hypothetical protein EI555_007451 [Monodon monoceros]|uniref:Transmembrane protein 61 n=1 Tax=Monodon monoceros TaxID=40151 RepID=A0A4U1EUM9_MONMO|nr:hypothetical protein EI555_007451 [Monodon monoceros]